MAKTTITETVLNAGQNDLLHLDQTIGDLERALEAHVAEQKKTIDALKAMRKAIDIRLNGRKAPVPKAAKTKGGEKSTEKSTVDKVFDLLTQEGPMPVPAIAARLGVSAPTIYNAINNKQPDWFAKKNGEVNIAK